MRGLAILVSVSIWSGCGESAGGDPLITGEPIGSFRGDPFSMQFGFARDITEPNQFDAVLQVFLGSSPISCAETFMGEPRVGTYAVLYVTGAEVGSYGGVFVNFSRVDGAGEITGGSTSGLVEITDITGVSLAATISYDQVVMQHHYGLEGAFEVVRCPE